MTIHVTQAHIDAGIRSECRLCPIALALQAAISRDVQVMSGSFLVFGGGGYVASLHALPEEVSVFIINFDEGSPVQPFSFEVNIPVEVPHA